MFYNTPKIPGGSGSCGRGGGEICGYAQEEIILVGIMS